MSDFTVVVRPNQTPDIRPSANVDIRRKPVTVAAPIDNTIVWGNSGNNAFQLQANVRSEVPQTMNEEKRTFSTVRVENPDDSEQYINTDVMTEYQGRNSINKSRFTLRFAKPETKDNIKVISNGNVKLTP